MVSRNKFARTYPIINNKVRDLYNRVKLQLNIGSDYNCFRVRNDDFDQLCDIIDKVAPK